MKNSWYNITDIDLFIESTRVLVYGAFGETKKELSEINISVQNLEPDEQEEMNNCLSQNESMTIAKQYLKTVKSKKSNKTYYRISEKSYMSLIESLNSRMISNMLQKLSKDGVLESAFDSDLNDFVFWVKDDESKDQNTN